MSALLYVDVPHYRALILRRNYADLALPGALMDRAQEWLQGSGARWRAATHSWHFPSGASLTFGYLQHEDHKYRYQGSEFQYVGFDELTQFSETQYTYLLSRLRRLMGQGMPLRMRGGSNPGGVGHDWVRARFVEETTRAPGCQFQPAKLSDNPSLDQKEYIRYLGKLDPVTRAQLLEGDWDVLPAGNMFRPEWWQIVDNPPPPDDILGTVRFWDLAATEAGEKKNKDPDYTATCKMSALREGRVIVTHSAKFRKSPRGVRDQIKSYAELDGLGVPIFIEQEGGGSGKTVIESYKRDILPAWRVEGVPSTESKVQRAKPVSAAVEDGRVQLLRAPWNRPLMVSAGAFPNPEVHDDDVDALSGAYNAIRAEIHDSGAAWGGLDVRVL